MRSRTSIVVPLLVAGALALAACGSDDSDSSDAAPAAPAAAEEEAANDCAVENLPLFEAGKLTIATGEPVFEPWMFDDDPTNGQGFESAVAYALADEMGFAAEDVAWVRTGFDEAIAPGDKPYDFNMQQYSITAERDEIVDFSLPYYAGQKSVIALEGTPAADATTFEELQAGTWGATIGTTDLDYIENVLGITDVAVYNTQADVVAAMIAGQIDATVVTLPTALYLTAVEIEGGKIVGVLPTESTAGTDGEGMGLLFAEGSGLVPCVNAALQTLTDDGTLAALAVEWLQGDGEIPTISG